ncbi:unnamed protein product [Amaranthus hypochondriacus]
MTIGEATKITEHEIAKSEKSTKWKPNNGKERLVFYANGNGVPEERENGMGIIGVLYENEEGERGKLAFMEEGREKGVLHGLKDLYKK